MRVYIGLGANISGLQGSSLQTMDWSISVLKRDNIKVKSISHWYQSRAMGQAGQSNYINGVALLETSLSPLALLRVLQKIEKKAGRSRGKIWSSRSLDLDILSYQGIVLSWQKPWVFSPYDRKMLILPHPEAHRRPFVMKPLYDIAPKWRHPVLGQSAQQLWHQLQKEKDGQILTVLKENTN